MEMAVEAADHAPHWRSRNHDLCLAWAPHQAAGFSKESVPLCQKCTRKNRSHDGGKLAATNRVLQHKLRVPRPVTGCCWLAGWLAGERSGPRLGLATRWGAPFACASSSALCGVKAGLSQIIVRQDCCHSVSLAPNLKPSRYAFIVPLRPTVSSIHSTTRLGQPAHPPADQHLI